MKDVGASVVAAGVENQVALGDAFRPDLGVDDTRFIEHRASQIASVGANDRAPPVHHQIVVLTGNRLQDLDPLVIQQAQRAIACQDVPPAQDAASRQHIATALKGVIPAGQLVEVVHGRPLGNVDGLVLGMHGGPGQRHPMLPADQAAQNPIVSIQHAQGAAIAPPPDQALGVGRDQLAVQLEAATVTVDVERGVIESASVALVGTHNQVATGFADHLEQPVQVSARNRQGVLEQQPEQRLGRGVIPERGIRRAVQPHRVTGQPSLWEGDHLGTLFGRLLDQGAGFDQALLKV